MDNKQRAKLDSMKRVKDYMGKHAADMSPIAEIAAETLVLNNNYDIIINASQIQEDDLSGETDAATAAKTAMANVVLKYIKRGRVKAHQLNNTALYEKLNKSVSFIAKAEKAVAVTRAGDLKKDLNDNLAILTNITAANITEIGNAITKYDGLKDAPQTDKGAQKATGTNVMPDAFRKGMKAIDNIYDLVYSYFYDTKKTLVEELVLIKAVVVLGVHHTGIEGEVRKGGEPVEGAVITLEGTKKKGVTDIYGHYSILRVKAGDFHFHCSLSTGEKQSEIIHITRGNIDTHDFEF